MRVFLRREDQTTETELRFDGSSDVVLSQAIERGAFKRAVSDIAFRAHDFDNSLKAAFVSAPASTRWILRVIADDRVMMRGETSKELTRFDVSGKWVELRTVSSTRSFWEQARTVRIESGDVYLLNSPSFSTGYATFAEAVAAFTRRGMFDRIFRSVDLGVFGSRSIRNTKLYTDAEVEADPLANVGRFNDLDPDTSFEDFLLAAAVYYNAEFFVDDETELLTMRPRASVLNDLDLDMTGRLYAEDLTIELVDEEKYDYVRAYVSTSQPSPPTLVLVSFKNESESATAITNGTYRYKVTSVLADGTESKPSDALVVEVFTAPTDPSTFSYQNHTVTVRVPAGIDGSVNRKLYRSGGVGGTYENRYGLVAFVTGNTATTVEDVATEAAVRSQYDAGNRLSDSSFVGAAAWIGYDESAGVWRSPIYDVESGRNQPSGSVFNVTPKLRFMDRSDRGSIHAATGTEVFCLFGRESSVFDVQTRWLPLMSTRRRASFTAKGTDYKIGDSFRLPPNLIGYPDAALARKFVIRSAKNNYRQKRTSIVGISVV